MKYRILRIVGLLMVLVSVAGLLPACQNVEAASSYVAILPAVLHSGRTEAISPGFKNRQAHRRVGYDSVTATAVNRSAIGSPLRKVMASPNRSTAATAAFTRRADSYGIG